MDNILETDMMSKVMNRRLGGGTSSSESSPIKRQTVSLENGADVQLDSQNCFSSNTYSNNESSVTNFSKCKYQEESVDIDEIDGFINDEVDNENHKDVTYGKSDVERCTKAIEVTDFEKNVHCVGQNHVTDEDADQNYGEYEYVMADVDITDTTEPRIEMFNESDSNSNSNPFILSSFQSLNARSNENTQKTKAKSETANGSVMEDYDESSEGNSQEFGWKREQKCYDHDDSNSQNSSHGLYQNDEDTVKDVECPEAERKIKKPRSDTSISKVENSAELQNESQAFNDKGSESENGSEAVSLHTNKVPVRVPESKRSAVFGIENDFNCKEVESEVTSDNKGIRSDTDEVKKEKVEKSSVKKSRKQYVPKRVRQIEPTVNNRSVCDGEMVEFSEHGECNKNIDQTTSNLNETSSSVQETTDKVTVKEHDELNKYEEVEQKKSEKSRKQCKPKRIDQLQIMDEKASVLNNENDETETPGMVSNMNEDSEKKYMIENECPKVQADECRAIETNDSNDSVCEVNVNTRYIDSGTGPVGSSKGLDESCTNSIKETESDSTEHSSYSLQSTPDGNSLNHFASLSSNPFYYGFAPDLNLISSLTPGMLQGGTSSSGSFALDENGPENLEVIRQLREIRCNRYRKISIAEKREISAYANTNGVSQAATYYNVSKSAVSMWTKLDFSNADEDSGTKRKNCMSGNEKFEALCRKVKNERENKFKGMSKQDKFEVSRYAKLVGVREMSRCLGVALGTVSGWMRQFPYKVESESSDEPNSKNGNKTKDNNEKSDTMKVEGQKEKSVKRRKSEQTSKGSKKQKKSEPNALETEAYKTIQKDDTMYILPVDFETENIDEDLSLNDSDIKAIDESVEVSATETDLDCSLEQKDELDKMIAETWQKPDIEKCFEDIKDMIKDSPLEGDDFFRSLFDRVIACRADKYKTLKPSEKLEVVRYAKRIGVRRVAKIMGLATGTLSGWNTKYQSSLGLTDPGLDMSNKTDLLVSYLSPDKESEKIAMTPGALMDNSQKSEVTAVKLLFKDRFPTLVQKIEIAKQVKFRNITTDEKIEFVKCSKLVGIRPTARVFGIPIGTLSGWISKYSKLLHPAYHVDTDQETASNTSESTSQNSHTGVYSPNIVGRSAGYQGGMSSNPAWPQVPGFIPGGQGLGLNLFPQLQSMSSSSSSSYSSSELFSSPSNTSETVSKDSSTETANDSKDLIDSQNKIYNDNQSMYVHDKRNSSDVPSINNQSNSTVVIKTEPEEPESQSVGGDDFEKEAKLMAAQYLTAAYKTMGIPIG